jgi:hypothetical protein
MCNSSVHGRSQCDRVRVLLYRHARYHAHYGNHHVQYHVHCGNSMHVSVHMKTLGRTRVCMPCHWQTCCHIHCRISDCAIVYRNALPGVLRWDSGTWRCMDQCMGTPTTVLPCALCHRQACCHVCVELTCMLPCTVWHLRNHTCVCYAIRTRATVCTVTLTSMLLCQV